MIATIKGLTFAALLVVAAMPQAVAQRPDAQPRATAVLGIDTSSLAPQPRQHESNFSTFFVPRQSPVAPAEFFNRFGRRLNLGTHDQMVESSRGQGVATGREFIRFRQYHHGVRVLGAGFRLVLDNDRVLWGSGQLATSMTPDMASRVGKDEALQRARNAMAHALLPEITGLTWPDQDNHEMLLVPFIASSADTQYQLVHSFILRPVDTQLSYRIFVHARSGDIVLLRSEAQEAWVPATATGNTTYDGNVGPFPVEQDVPATTHRLQSPGVITLSMANATPGTWDVLEPQMVAATDIESDSDVFTDPAHANGVSAHFGSVAALDMFRNGLGIPLANAPQITNYVDVPLTEGFALILYWLNKSMFGTTSCPIVALDVIGHEMGHFLTHQIYPQFSTSAVGEAGSLIESFADIMGQLLEIWVKGSSDWISAQAIACPEFLAKGKVRNLMNPTLSSVPQPDFYFGQNWGPTSPANDTNDYGSKHHNNSLQNKWFYLLARGGQGSNTNGGSYDVQAVGDDTAVSVLLDTHEQLSDTSTYPEARDASDLAAAGICGEFSQARVSSHDSWHAVGLNPAPFAGEDFVQPADGDSDVHPWPALLSFEAAAQFPEDSWIVQVADDFDFTLNVQSQTASATSLVNNVQVGVAEFNLDADKLYFWRVRHSSTPPTLNCWRPVRSFSTTAVTVDPISPVIERTRGEPVHPWELEFSWSAHSQATFYTIEVSKSANYDPPLTQRAETSDTKVVLDALVDDMQYWRVRPNFVADDNTVHKGAWSEAMFLTSMPHVLLSNPQQGEQVYPWPVNFEWKPVTGADHYIFEIKLARSGWGDPDGEPHAIKIDVPDTSYKLNLRGDDHLISYTWRVRVIGPKIELLALQEEGQPGQGYMKARGSLTMAEPITKGPDKCVNLYQPLALDWQSVPEASQYHVQVYEARCPMNQVCDRGNELASFGVPAQPSSVQTHEFTPQPMSHPDAVGIVWEVTSFGPGGIPGMSSGLAWPPVLIQPTQPQMLSPDNMFDLELGEPGTLTWVSQHAHWGGFVLNVYKGSNSSCQDQPQFSTVVNGASNGQNSIVLNNLQFDSGTHNHSWKVKPHVGGLTLQGQFYQSCNLPVWSHCAKFRVVETVPDLTAPTVPPGLWGTVGSVLAMWSVVQGAEYYQVEVRHDAPNGPLLDIYQWNVAFLTNHMNQVAQSLNISLVYPIQAWFAVIPGAVPLNRYFYRVKACAGGSCGPPSDWSEWWETYPWPW